jgi:hypothetical protein
MSLHHLVRSLVLALLLGALSFVTASAQQRPLITEDVDIIPPGTLRIEAGCRFHAERKVSCLGYQWRSNSGGCYWREHRYGPKR